MTTPETRSTVTVRCPFCATRNRIDFARAADRPQCGQCKKPILLDRPIRVEQEDFATTVLEATVPVLVDFYADWCAPCKLVAPLVDEFARDHVGRLLVAKLDTDRAPDVSVQYRIRGIPTLILFKDGAEAARSVGFEPEKLRAMVAGAV